MFTLLLLWVLAATQPLPGFEEFRQMDAERQAAGQLHTAQSLELTRVAPELIAATVAGRSNDVQLLWGAAELSNAWPAKRAYYEAALAASATNVAIAFRFAVAAAHANEPTMARAWAELVAARDPGNAAPLLVKAWLDGHCPSHPTSRPSQISRFDDYAVPTATARIALLAAAGYSPYAARRLGTMPDAVFLGMIQELCRLPVDTQDTGWLLAAGRAMQRSPTYLLTELVGQRLETAAQSPSPERSAELTDRREQLMELIAAAQRDAVPGATEAEMTRYFDEVLARGEEAALRRLVNRAASGAASD